MERKRKLTLIGRHLAPVSSLARSFPPPLDASWELTPLDQGLSESPSLWAQWRFARWANRLLRQRDMGLTLGLENGVFADIYFPRRVSHTGLAAWLQSYGVRRSLRFAKCVLARSELMKSRLVAQYPDCASKMAVLYGSFDAAQCHPTTSTRQQERSRLSFEPQRPLILFASDDWEQDGLALAMDFCAYAKSLAANPAEEPLLAVMGQGDRAWCRKLALARKLADRVRLVGSPKNAADYYRSADVMVLPTRYHPFSAPSLAALACGCPVVTSELNGVAELIRHEETGFILNVASMRKAVSWWLRNRTTSEEIAASVSGFTVENESLRLAEILEKVASDLPHE